MDQSDSSGSSSTVPLPDYYITDHVHTMNLCGELRPKHLWINWYCSAEGLLVWRDVI